MFTNNVCYFCKSAPCKCTNFPMGYPQYPVASAKGWECPKCGSVYSPTTPQCFNCKPITTNDKDMSR